MWIEKYMTADPISIDKDMSIIRAAERMKEAGVRRFPVVHNDELIGMVTDRDLRSASPSQVVSFDKAERKLMPELYDLLANIKVGEIMKSDVVTVSPEQSVVKAAETMLKYHISGLPVVDSRKGLVGIITESDIFKIIVDFSGIKAGKTTFGFRLEDSPGSIKKVNDIIHENDGRIASILTPHSGEEPGHRHVYIRMRNCAPEKIEKLKTILEEKFDLLSVIDDT